MGDSILIFGEVTHAAVSDAVLDGSHPRIELLEPLSRLGLDEWRTLGTIQDLNRIRLKDWPGHFRPKA